MSDHIRKIILVLLLNQCALHGFGQTFTLVNETGPSARTVYLGLPNNISISVESYRNRDIVLSTDNGKIEMKEDYGFYLSPDSLGKGNITIKARSSKGIKELGKWQYRVVNIPIPVAQVGGKSGGEIRKDVFKSQLGIVSAQNCCGFDARFVVQSFSVMVIRGNELIFAKNRKGQLFKGSINDFFRSDLQVGDVVIFCNIYCLGPDRILRLIAPIQFKIID